MIEFGYLRGGWGSGIYDQNIIGLINKISDSLPLRIKTLRFSSGLADFDGMVYVTGWPLRTLPDLVKQFENTQEQFPPKETLNVWNELIFNLYPDNSIIQKLSDGHIQGVGLCYPEQRLYGGHLLLESDQIELSVSLTSIDILFELAGDIFLGLQSLLAIISNIEHVNIGGWRLTLRPGMLYEEIFNGTKEGIGESGK